ncbi:MAG: hypothetical protein Q4D37_05915 [Oscillospiraceae bacterium]|nr:hypothetical protein [Oscillospiraceae bacterium]
MAINIEDIMSEIRSDIQQKGLNSSMLSFADVPCDANPDNPTESYDPDTFRSNVQYVSTQYQVQPYRPLTGNPILVFCKKVLRRLMRFYIEPIAQEQTYFNANTAQALQEVEMYIIDTQTHSNAALAARIADLELQQKNSRMQIDALTKQVESLQKQLAAKEVTK